VQLSEKAAFLERLKSAIGALEALETPENAPLIKQLKQVSIYCCCCCCR
jgi:hypothetical protein